MAISQGFYLILDGLNSPLGFFANATEVVYLAEDLVRDDVVGTVPLSPPT